LLCFRQPQERTCKMSGEGQVASGRVTEDELLGAAVAAATDQHFDKLSEADAETDETPEVTDTDPEGNEEVEGEGEVEGDEAEGTKDLDEDDEATESERSASGHRQRAYHGAPRPDRWLTAAASVRRKS